MKQIGIVVENNNDKVIVAVKRSSACGDNCKSCGASCKLESHKVSAINHIGAQIGDWVELELEDKKILFAAFLIYIIPIVFFFLGYGLSEIFLNSVLINVLIGLVLSAFVYIFIRKYDENHKKSNKYIPVITKKI